MDVPRDFLEIIVRVDQEGMVAALVKMTGALVAPIVPGRVADVEMPHELLEIPQGCLHQQVKVVTHQDVGKNLRLVDDNGASQEVEKSRTVCIRRKDNLAGVTAAGDMVVSVLVLDS